jgi:Bacterial membrane protein YfhO
VLGIALFGGGPILSLLQLVPLFKTNYIGRTLSVLGFLVAALAALGFQALLERRRGEGARPLGRAGWVRVTVVGVAALGLAVTVGLRGRDWAQDHGVATTFADAVRQAGLFGVVAVAGIVALLVMRGHARALVAALLVVVAAVQSLAFSLPLLPNESRDTLYPETPGLAYLQEHLGDERLAAEGATFYGNTTMLFGLRNVGGHSFFPPTWKEMLRMASPEAFDSSPTLSYLDGTQETATTPLFDRMGVRYFVGTPGHPPLGAREGRSLDETVCEPPADTDVVTVLPGATAPAQPAPAAPDDVVARLRVPGGSGLRGVVLRSCEDAHLEHGAALEVTASAGGETATGALPLRPTVIAGDLPLPVAGDTLGGEEDIEVTVRLRGGPPESLTLATTPEGTLATNLIRPGQDDGLRLAHADDLRIYERLNALPRVRWAGRSQVIDEPGERVATLAGGRVPDDTVILSQGESGGSGAGGTVDQVAAGDTLRLEVDAEGDGYAVVADAMQSGWAATVDGEPVEVLDADHSGVAVAVPAGRHVVEFAYRPEGQRVGFVLSVLSAACLAAALGWTAVRRRRSARRPTTPHGSGVTADLPPGPVPPPTERTTLVGDPTAGERDASTEVPS